MFEHNWFTSDERVHMIQVKFKMYKLFLNGEWQLKICIYRYSSIMAKATNRLNFSVATLKAAQMVSHTK